MRRKRIAWTALAALVLLAGCDYLPFGYTPIREIVAAPGPFEGKEVKIRGKVTQAIKLPILGQSFVVSDDTGEITVTTNGPLPAPNAEIALTGIVKSAAIIGGQSIGLRVEETKRLR